MSKRYLGALAAALCLAATAHGQSTPNNWGLHLVDANLAMGNLVDIVGQQSKAWLTLNRPKP